MTQTLGALGWLVRISGLAHHCEATESPKAGEMEEFARGRESPSVGGDQENFISKDKAWAESCRMFKNKPGTETWTETACPQTQKEHSEDGD